MRIMKYISALALLWTAAAVSPVGAQVFYPSPHESEGRFVPFIDPESFNPDYQLFQTVDYDPFHGTREYNTGFFGSYDRAYMWVSRPNHEQSFTVGDFTWGNHYNFGFMTEERTGWLVTHWDINGPGANHMLRIERLNRVEEDDDVGLPPPPDPTQPQQDDPLFPVQDRNNHFFDNELPPALPPARDYFLVDSLNDGHFTSWELNKTWRLVPYHNGAILEPMIGLRYMKFIDYNINDSYIGPFDTDFGTPATPTPVIAETFIRDLDTVQNDMFGGQLGFRYYHTLQRWQISNETRFFAAQNFQNQRQMTRFVTTGYGDIGNDEDVIAERIQEINTYANNSEFVFGIDVKATVAYQLTRDVSLRVGGSYMHLGKGVWRGPAQFNNQDLIMAGVTMGVEVNR